MKIYLEGSVAEIEQFLYGDGVEAVEAEEDGKCEYESSDLSPNEKLKLNLINAFANTIDALINFKAKG